ncbi:monocarboxylate transporter 9-like [Lytechinus variegatus]|uniref:monocarboxylate transporter 9-like n=1 Tax=Lytechinus variegatus TaxID=7654 RepID=UPI001BB29BB2|nr:monocarboxylate transporter 9-like [Lytechinus variegatus]
MARPGARIILAARFSFFCMEIGLAKSFGVLIPELEEQLQTSNAIIGLITSLSLATMYLGSPISKMLIHRCARPRILTTLSGFAAGCALIGTAFTRNLILMSILFMVVGLCCSVVNLQALVLLHEYYQEEFPFASCISVLGIPFGAVVLPPVTEKLLEQYGLSGTLLVVGALVLNMLPIGLVLKDPRNSPRIPSPVEEREQEQFMQVITSGTEEYDQITSSENNRVGSQHDQRDDHLMIKSGQRQAGEDDGVNQCQGPELSSETFVASIGDAKHTQVEEPEIYLDERDMIGQLSQYSASSSLNRTDGSMVSSCLALFHFDVLIKEPLFSLLFLPSVLLTFLVTGGWALFIVKYAVEHGIDIARGTYLATSGAISGIVSSVVMSVGLRYRPAWSPQYLLWNQLLPTAIFFFQILHSSYIYLVVMSFLIGFGLFGANVTVEAVMSEIVQTKNFPDASSIFYLSVGIGYILSGYVAGFVRDQTGDIELLFVFLGVTSLISCCLTLATIIVLRRKGQSRDSGFNSRDIGTYKEPDSQHSDENDDFL